MLELQHVSYAYPGHRRPAVLTDCSLQLPAGVHLLRGPSGCGKSTLLRLLAGYLTPDQGRVCTPGGAPATERHYQLHRMGFVFQSINLLELATVGQNVAMAGRLAGLSRAESAARTRIWLQQLGVADLADERPDRISGGQRQRAAFARALVKHPDVLLLDEPTSGLDETNTTLLAQAFQNYQRAAAAQRIVVVAAHDERLVAFADHAWRFEAQGPVPA
jgi:ABC-type lipoprotein export system ATPase subunit